MSVRILIGDMRRRLRDLPDASADSVVCDPPYHLTSIVKRFGSPTAAPAKVGKTGAYARASKGFMGQTWDGGDVAFDPDTWAEVLRVLKPGGHLVAFSGTRTYHRMVCAIEDAGFEVRDQLAWVYGSGFPKSLDVSKQIDKAAGAERAVVGINEAAVAKQNKRPTNETQCTKSAPDTVGIITAPATEAAQQWQGWGTALKPSWEPICLARKPLIGSVASNVLAHGTGALNIDGCRIEGESTERHTFKVMTSKGAEGGAYGKQDHEYAEREEKLGTGSPLGRWPANLCWGCPEDEYFLKSTATAEQRRELYGWLSENA